MNKLTKALVAIIAVIIIILAFNQLKTTPKDTSDIKIGSVAPLSGDAASLGEFIKNVTDMAVEKVNADGGVNGRKISVIWEDDQCNPSKAVSSVQKLINTDKVKIIIGSTCSGDVVSFLPIAKQNNVMDPFYRTLSSYLNIVTFSNF